MADEKAVDRGERTLDQEASFSALQLCDVDGDDHTTEGLLEGADIHARLPRSVVRERFFETIRSWGGLAGLAVAGLAVGFGIAFFTTPADS